MIEFKKGGCCAACGAPLDDELFVNKQQRIVYWCGQDMFYGRRTLADYFIILHEAKGGYVSYDEIVREVYGTGRPVEPASVTGNMTRLRAWINKAKAPFVIETQYGVGYRMLRVAQ